MTKWFTVAFLFILPMQLLRPATPAALYLQEGFNGGGIPAGWTQNRISGVQAAWSVVGTGSNPVVPPFAGAGQATFNSFDASSGEQARLTTPPINLVTAADPFLTFFMYHEDEYFSSFDSLYVEVTTGDSINGPWTTLLGARRARATSGWSKELVSLFPYRGTSRLFLSVRGVSRYGNNMYIDEFRVADSSFHDIGIIALLPAAVPSLTTDGQQNAKTGSRVSDRKQSEAAGNDPDKVIPLAIPFPSQLPIQAVARNRGTYAEASYNVGWQVDGQIQQAVTGNPIAARTGQDTTTLTWSNPSPGIHTVGAWTILPSDSNRFNDTVRSTFQVLEPGTVFYESFNGGTFPPTGWTVINRDGGQLAPWFRGADTSAFVPFEGTGFAADNFQRANGTYLDDYLITPPIAGIAQPGMVDSIVFRTRSQNNQPPAINFPDSLMVLVSTSGPDTTDFSILLDYFAVPKSGWSRKAYSLAGRVPSNSTIRVAFRYLLRNVQPASGSGDFIGIDGVQIIRGLPASASAGPLVAQNFTLGQNYPNPFNPVTTIQFSTPYSSFANLTVFDILGRPVATLVSGTVEAGFHTVQFVGSDLPSGVYVYRLLTGGFAQTKRMTVVK